MYIRSLSERVIPNIAEVKVIENREFLMFAWNKKVSLEESR